MVVVVWVASEYAHDETILVTAAVCGFGAALIGRWWALLVPVALIVAVLGAAQISWYYERVPEDIQAGMFVGALIGLVLAALGVLVRQRIGRPRTGRHPSDFAL